MSCHRMNYLRIQAAGEKQRELHLLFMNSTFLAVLQVLDANANYDNYLDRDGDSAAATKPENTIMTAIFTEREMKNGF